MIVSKKRFIVNLIFVERRENWKEETEQAFTENSCRCSFDLPPNIHEYIVLV